MIVIPENLPADLAPFAWMLGTWEGWGMHTPYDPSVDSLDEENAISDVPVIERITCEVFGDRMRMETSIYAATVKPGIAEVDPMWDSREGLDALDAGDLLWHETAFLHLLPGTGELPPPGEFLPRELRGTGATIDGLGVLWAGVIVGPRVQMISDAVARDPQALPVSHLGRMYGLVNSELLWTQERGLETSAAQVHFSGRLMRVSDADGAHNV